MHERLLIRIDAASQRNDLLHFLGRHGCTAGAEDAAVVVDDCSGQNPGLATLVALVEEWRSAAHVPEAVLEVGDRRTVLRTES